MSTYREQQSPGWGRTRWLIIGAVLVAVVAIVLVVVYAGGGSGGAGGY